MIISKKIIRHPRVAHKCADCGRRITGPKMRLYGSADRWDPKYTIYLHISSNVKLAREILRSEN